MYNVSRRVDKDSPNNYDPFGVTGFEDDIFGKVFGTWNTTNFPPFNIVDIGDHKYVIELAIAGFLKNEISVESENGILTVTGKKVKTTETRKYINKGIALRDFARTFNLSSDVVVESATFENGMLTINLFQVQPEVKKKNTILIK